MAIVNYQPNRMTKHLDDGEYQGVLTELIYNENYDTFWFKIKLQNQIFCTSLSGKSFAMNNFAIQCLNEDGNFDTDSVINMNITFSVENKANGEYSKIKNIIIKSK